MKFGWWIATRMGAAYKPIVSGPSPGHAPDGPALGSGAPSSRIPPAIQWLRVRQRARPMATPSQIRLPVVLLGGVNLVRTLGLAGIPAVVAMPDPDEPAFASRYCSESHLIPPFDPGEPAVEAIVAIGRRLARECRRRVPLMYGSDDA